MAYIKFAAQRAVWHPPNCYAMVLEFVNIAYEKVCCILMAFEKGVPQSITNVRIQRKIIPEKSYKNGHLLRLRLNSFAH